LTAIERSEAEQVLVTHGYTRPMVQWLRENGKQAREVVTKFHSDGTQRTDLLFADS
jgi:hypothetical protein